jgi:hypothetical protein
VLKFNTLIIANVAKKVNSSHVSKCRVFCSGSYVIDRCEIQSVFLFFYFFFKVKYALALLGQIMQSFQLNIKNFHYSLCEIQSVFSIFLSLFFFKKKYFILIFCLLLVTNLFKALFEIQTVFLFLFLSISYPNAYFVI